MTTIVANGQTYDLDDLNGYDLYNVVTAGTGDSVPLWVAIHLDLIADSSNNCVSTSTSSNSVGTGSKTFVLAEELPLFAGMRVQVVDAGDDANVMWGAITSWTAATKTVIIDVDKIDGSGTIASWNFAGKVGATGAAGSMSNLIDDTTPQLGGDLDVNGNAIISASNGDIDITPNGTGEINLNKLVNAAAGVVGFRPSIDVTATRALALTDANQYLYASSGSATEVTVPANATVAFATGTEIDLFVYGAGAFTLTAASGVTINGVTAGSITIEQYNGGSLKKIATNTWQYIGQNSDQWA